MGTGCGQCAVAACAICCRLDFARWGSQHRRVFSWWRLCLWYFVCCFWAPSVNSVLVSPAVPSSCVPYLHVDFSNPVFRRCTEVPVGQVPAVPRAPEPVLLMAWLHRQTPRCEQQCSWNGVWPVSPVPACRHSRAMVGPAEAHSQQLSHLPRMCDLHT